MPPDTETVMSSPLQIKIHDRRQLVYTTELTGTLELGRQSSAAETPYTHSRQGDQWRIVVARLDEAVVSRKHILVEPLADSKVRLRNISEKLPARIEAGPELKPLSALEAALPVVLVLGNKSIRIQQPVTEDGAIQGLANMTVAPGSDAGLTLRFAAVKPLSEGAVDVDALVPWMRTTMDVLNSATGPKEFFASAARAVVDLVGLDAGRVLLVENGEWQPRTIVTRSDDIQLERQASRQVLGRVREEKRTCWQVPTSSVGSSLMGVSAVVAAPILNRHGEVIGALYGDRAQQGGGSAKPITKLEAMLVELLASGVASGLTRVEHEQAAQRTMSQFEQFFGRDLGRELAAHPELLEPKDEEITVLVCDIRGFSRITEKQGPARTIEWINEVFGILSNCILEEGGVLVDYVGDEVMSMFGPPFGHKDHARRACRAALAMLGHLPKMQERWHDLVQGKMGLGIGINSGIARIGNVGSKHKFKYGALGNTVNLASRVQGATKYLKATALLTEATKTHLDDSFATRRLCQVRVVNIEKPVSLYEMVGAQPPGWPDLKKGYEEALEQFEKKQFLQSAHVLGKLLPQHPSDGPTQALLSRAVSYLLEEPKNFEAVWELSGK